ncbi:DNA alkylation repair protein [archaeon]|jgi:3-methyladenine DNA glycosylase AlkD|nr:DNA alkylation repair protein [archaeon]
MINQLNHILKQKANPEKAQQLQRFFKTKPGQYGEGDIFLGITVPEQRKLVKQFNNLEPKDVQQLLNSKIHEKRLIALLILIQHYNQADNEKKQKIVNFYLNNTNNINNWDLVDLSAPNILGDYLNDKPKDILYKLAKSENLWEKRIAIISTLTFIRNNQFQDTLKISKILLNDTHDLIHKAVGWMLRELGKRDQQLLEKFLKQNYSKLPRTTLRYAIERFEENKRKKFLKGNFKN